MPERRPDQPGAGSARAAVAAPDEPGLPLQISEGGGDRVLVRRHDDARIGSGARA